jgi:hypothetical protein
MKKRKNAHKQKNSIPNARRQHSEQAKTYFCREKTLAIISYKAITATIVATITLAIMQK